MSDYRLDHPLAASIGDPAGIGPELLCEAWARRETDTLPPFFVVGSVAVLAGAARSRGLEVPLLAIDTPDQAAACFADVLPVLDIGGLDFAPGEPSEAGAELALQALEVATGIVRGGGAAALVTAPVAKSQLAKVGFTHPGQTEYVAERCGVAARNAVMMLAGPSLRVVPITVHAALAEVPGMLTAELVRARTAIAAAALGRDFGIERPRIAVAGLNPHAGEDGRFGSEERTIIAPAIAQLREDGWEVAGPLPADGMFHAEARARYDLAVCMYHDQALIPLKTLDFDEGVNVTLGLPIIRTSPDHGTAFSLAGNRAARGEPLSALPPLREVIARHGLSAHKALGQNFLFDEQLLDRIAAVPGALEGREVLEIGPGPGGLTRALLRAGARVTAIEMDSRCLPALAELSDAYPGRLRVLAGDALKLEHGMEGAFHVVANLPYNVGTALLVRWLGGEAWPPPWISLTLMFQQEVAQRIVAAPGSDAYGRLAVLAQWRSRARLAMKVHRSAFTPPPKVMSAVVYIEPGAMPEGVSARVLERVTEAAFGQRRKMLRQSLKGLPGANEALERLGIAAERRAETLSVSEFVAIARELS